MVFKLMVAMGVQHCNVASNAC